MPIVFEATLQPYAGAPRTRLTFNKVKAREGKDWVTVATSTLTEGKKTAEFALLIFYNHLISY